MILLSDWILLIVGVLMFTLMALGAEENEKDILRKIRKK